MKHSIYGLELEFEPIDTLAYKDSVFYKMMESTTSLIFGNCIGRVKIVVDDGKVIGEQMPLFSMHGFKIYTKEEVRDLQSAVFGI